MNFFCINQSFLVGLMIFNLFVYKRLSNPSRPLSIGRKLVIGMILASLSMCIAGIVEIFRQNQCISGNTFSFQSQSSSGFLFWRQRWFELKYLCTITSEYLHGSCWDIRNSCKSRICLSGCSAFSSSTSHEFTILFIRCIISYW